MIKNVMLMPGFSGTNEEIVRKALKKTVKILKDCGAEVWAEPGIAEKIDNYSVTPVEKEEICGKIDLVIAIGGDGTMMRAARLAVLSGAASLGINAGRLGFLAQLEYEDIEKLSLLARGKYEKEERMLLEFEVKSACGIKRGFVLNDVVASKTASGRTADVSIYRNGNFVYHYRADGVILSTPTGSTAYSMSAGGPVCDPDASLMIMTPIAPHTLFSKSVIFPDGDTIILKGGGEALTVTADGEEIAVISGEDTVEISKAAKKATFLRLGEQNFYETFNRKFSERR